MKNGKVAGVSLSTATTKAHAFFRNLQDCFKLLRGTRYATPLCSTEWYSGMRALCACQWPTYELTERARQTLLGSVAMSHGLGTFLAGFSPNWDNSSGLAPGFLIRTSRCESTEMY